MAMPNAGCRWPKAALRRSPRDPSRGSLLAALGFAQFAVRNYEAAAQAAEAALAEAAGSATPLILGTIAWVGAGASTGPRRPFARVAEIAPNPRRGATCGEMAHLEPPTTWRERIPSSASPPVSPRLTWPRCSGSDGASDLYRFRLAG